MLILVTGATGLVGNNVVRHLLDQGQAVRVLQREASDPRPLAGLPIEIAKGDIRDLGSLALAAQGVDCIVHAAAYVHVGWSGVELHRSINVEGTRNVVAAALKNDARLVHVSSVDALGLGTRAHPADEDTPPDPRATIPYIVSKRQAEQVVMQGVGQGLQAVIVNPTYMLGPWDWKPSSGRMLLRIARGRALLAPRGGNDFCDVRDVAAGIWTAARTGKVGQRYILGGEPLSYLAAWRMFAELVGVRAPVCRAGPMMIVVAGWSGDVWRRLSGVEPDVNSATAKMSFKQHHFSYRRAAAELGYAPRPAREAASAAWEWFLQHGYARAVASPTQAG
jgi:dihydroflavonol-4-reductase